MRNSCGKRSGEPFADTASATAVFARLCYRWVAATQRVSQGPWEALFRIAVHDAHQEQQQESALCMPGGQVT
jgi:hypothetical protein